MNVNILSNFGSWPILRQSNKSLDHFYFQANNFTNASSDICVVYEDLPAPTHVKCRRGGLWLFTAEPECIKKYSQKYLNQFDFVVTSQKLVRHRNVKYTQTSLPWHIGLTRNGTEYINVYNHQQLSMSPTKDKLMSVIISDKKITKDHVQRAHFVGALKEHFGDDLHIFGKGIRAFDDKKEIIDSYKYHIVIENSYYVDYWTEKIGDCFIGEAYPFYYGCPNLSDYFNKESFSAIDIRDLKASIKTIENAIANNEFENKRQFVLDSKKLVMNQYNLLNHIKDLALNVDLGRDMTGTVLLPEKSLKNVSEKLGHYYNSLQKKIRSYT